MKAKWMLSPLPVLSLSVITLFVAGCVGTPTPPDSSVTHPANPEAPESPVPPFEPGLLALTNLALAKPAAEPATEHDHDHGQHEAEPDTEAEP